MRVGASEVDEVGEGKVGEVACPFWRCCGAEGVDVPVARGWGWDCEVWEDWERVSGMVSMSCDSFGW